MTLNTIISIDIYSAYLHTIQVHLVEQAHCNINDLSH